MAFPRSILGSLIAVAISVAGIIGASLAMSSTPATSAPSTTTTATAPTTLPATFCTGVGSAFGVRATYNAGPAPCVGWFDARNVSVTLEDTVTWNFGDGNELYPNPQFTSGNSPRAPPKVGANADVTGQIAGHWYEFAGTYHVVCTVTHPTGPASTYTATVVVTADTRRQVYFDNAGSDTNGNGTAAKPYKTATKLSSLVSSGNVNCHLGHGWAGTMPGTCIVGSLSVVQGDGSAVLTPDGGCPAFAGIGNGSTAHFLCWGVTITGATSHVATITGTDWAFIDCTLGTLDRGFYGHGVDGLLIQGCKQPVADSIASQVVYVDSATRLCVDFCSFLGSLDESTFRIDVLGGVGGASGVTRCWNLIAQPGEAKAASTIRAGSDIASANNVYVNADDSYNVGIGNATGTIGDVRVTNVVSRGDTIVTNGNPACCRILPGVIGMKVTSLDFHGTPTQAAVTVSPNWSAPTTLAGIVIEASTFSGGKGVSITGAPPTATPANGVKGSTVWPGAVIQ